AASVLLDYAGERPDVLAGLLMDADAGQFAALLPKVREHGKQAAALLRRELGRNPEPAGGRGAGFQPAGGEAGQMPAPRVVEEVEQARGMVAEHFALCQALPLGRFAAVAEALGRSGYRPVRFRPYVRASGGLTPPAAVQVAAVWARDGRDWQM